jgi:hypothetical protein
MGRAFVKNASVSSGFSASSISGSGINGFPAIARISAFRGRSPGAG